MRKFSLLCLFTVACLYSNAQSPNDEVKNAVTDYVDAFYYGDTTKIHRSIAPDVVKYGYYRAKAKTTYDGEPMSFKEMMDYANSVRNRAIKLDAEKFPKQIDVFDVQDQTASAKLTAWWGTDYLLLAKKNDRWMITHVVWQSPPPKS